jgi:hypothetical protein
MGILGALWSDVSLVGQSVASTTSHPTCRSPQGQLNVQFPAMVVPSDFPHFRHVGKFYLLQMGVTHWFSIVKARQELGYVPFIEPKEGIRRTLEFWKEEQSKVMSWAAVYIWILVIGGMSLPFCAGFLPPYSTGIFEVVQRLVLMIVGSPKIARVIFVTACILHVIQGVYAWFWARRIDPENAKAWFWQTTILGFPSLLLLWRHAWRT